MVKREKRATGAPATNKLKPTSIHNILLLRKNKQNKQKHLGDVELKQGIYSSLAKNRKSAHLAKPLQKKPRKQRLRLQLKP